MKTQDTLIILFTLLLFSGCLGRFLDPREVCDPVDLGLVPGDSIRFDGGGFEDYIPWTHEYNENKQILTIEWEGLCGDECQGREILEFDVSDPDCVTLRLHVLKVDDYYDGKSTIDIGTADFKYQEYVPDSLLAGENERARFWITF